MTPPKQRNVILGHQPHAHNRGHLWGGQTGEAGLGWTQPNRDPISLKRLAAERKKSRFLHPPQGHVCKALIQQRIPPSRDFLKTKASAATLTGPCPGMAPHTPAELKDGHMTQPVQQLVTLFNSTGNWKSEKDL